jgi:rhodanese-related sulfurtransferase
MPVIDISAEELREMLKNKKDQTKIIDVREPEEYAIIRIKGSKLIPMGELMNRLDEIDWSKEVIFVCRSGNRSRHMAEIAGIGKEVKNLKHGIYECYASGKNNNLEIDEAMIGEYF